MNERIVKITGKMLRTGEPEQRISSQIFIPNGNTWSLCHEIAHIDERNSENVAPQVAPTHRNIDQKLPTWPVHVAYMGT